MSTRIIRIEPSPFAKVKVKVKMARNKVDTLGRPMKQRTREGKIINTRELIDAENLVQFPGTIKYLRPAVCRDGLRTGLNVIVKNPYKDEDFYTQSWAENRLRGKEKALLQHILEYKHNKPLGYYNNSLSQKVYRKDEEDEIPFFHSPKCKLPLEGNVFFLDLRNELHEVMYYVAKANNIVANSFEELAQGRNPEALYYIVDETEAANIKTVKSKRINEAIAVIEKLEKEAGELVNFGKALGLTDPIKNDRQAYEALEKYFKKDSLSYENFMFYWKMYNNPINKDQFKAAIKLYDSITAGVVSFRNGIYYWQKPATDLAPAEVKRYMTKDKIISELFLDPASKEDLEIIEGLINEYKKYNI